MLEPPPSAKPFTTDVDKKLEEGQKVITFFYYASSYLKEFSNIVSLVHVKIRCFFLMHSPGSGYFIGCLTSSFTTL